MTNLTVTLSCALSEFREAEALVSLATGQNGLTPTWNEEEAVSVLQETSEVLRRGGEWLWHSAAEVSPWGGTNNDAAEAARRLSTRLSYLGVLMGVYATAVETALKTPELPSPTVFLGAGDEFTISGTPHAQSLSDVRSYSLKYKEDVEAADKECRSEGHETVWANGLAIVISNPPQAAVSRPALASGTIASYRTADGKTAIVKIESPRPLTGDNARVTVLRDWAV